MKKVFNKADDVIHLFAQQTQEEANSRNIFFKGKKLYSYGYHYLLAEFIDDETILINDRGYSVTTSKHISATKYATRQYKQFFTSKIDLKTVNNRVTDLLSKMANARKPEIYINQILDLWESLNEYLKYKKTITQVKKSVEYKNIAKAVKLINNDLSSFKESLLKAKKKEAEKKALKIAKDLKWSLEKFYNHEISSFRIGDEDFLRLSLAKDRVETSQGVKIGIDNAKMLYKSILEGGVIQGTKIQGYKIISIDGTLKVGCHNINMDSVHKVGKILVG